MRALETITILTAVERHVIAHSLQYRDQLPVDLAQVVALVGNGFAVLAVFAHGSLPVSGSVQPK